MVLDDGESFVINMIIIRFEIGTYSCIDQCNPNGAL